MRTLRFTHSVMPYRRGDAVFEDAIAERIIGKGFAEPVGGEGEDTAPVEERPAETRRRRPPRSDDQG